MKKLLDLHRGVNLGGWLSQCDYSAERLNHFIEAEDFARIASWGLDHVRIPVDYNVLEDDRGGYDAPGWERLDFALAQCEKHGLKTVIDLHKTFGFSFDKGEAETGFFSDEACQQRFLRLWDEITRRYGHLHERVVFELLNEVTSPEFMPVWNRVAGEAIRRIHQAAPEMLVLVGSYHNNSAPAVPALDPPADDKVVYNFHSYDPLHYTHQGAYWVDSLDRNARVPFAQSGATQEMFEKHFAPAFETAEARNVGLYCGEYGVIDVVDPADALEWFRTINAVFEKHGVARAVWSYKGMDFGIGDPRWDALRDELIKVL